MESALELILIRCCTGAHWQERSRIPLRWCFQPLTVELWVSHRQSRYSLGVIPAALAEASSAGVSCPAHQPCSI